MVSDTGTGQLELAIEDGGTNPFLGFLDRLIWETDDGQSREAHCSIYFYRNGIRV